METHGSRAQALASLATRRVRRDTLRLAVFFGSPPFCTERISSGSAALMATSAAAWSPDAIASSTLRTKPRTRERRFLLMAVRRAILRAAFFAEVVLAIGISLCGSTAAVAPCHPGNLVEKSAGAMSSGQRRHAYRRGSHRGQRLPRCYATRRARAAW